MWSNPHFPRRVLAGLGTRNAPAAQGGLAHAGPPYLNRHAVDASSCPQHHSQPALTQTPELDMHAASMLYSGDRLRKTASRTRALSCATMDVNLTVPASDHKQVPMYAPARMSGVGSWSTALDRTISPSPSRAISLFAHAVSGAVASRAVMHPALVANAMGRQRCGNALRALAPPRTPAP